jgi:hypothetical protein
LTRSVATVSRATPATMPSCLVDQTARHDARSTRQQPPRYPRCGQCGTERRKRWAGSIHGRAPSVQVTRWPLTSQLHSATASSPAGASSATSPRSFDGAYDGDTMPGTHNPLSPAIQAHTTLVILWTSGAAWIVHIQLFLRRRGGWLSLYGEHCMMISLREKNWTEEEDEARLPPLALLWPFIHGPLDDAPPSHRMFASTCPFTSLNIQAPVANAFVLFIRRRQTPRHPLFEAGQRLLVPSGWLCHDPLSHAEPPGGATIAMPGWPTIFLPDGCRGPETTAVLLLISRVDREPKPVDVRWVTRTNKCMFHRTHTPLGSRAKTRESSSSNQPL